MIVFVEAVKAGLKLREYYQLIHKEKVSSYLELESYKELTLLKEIKEGHIELMRTKRRMQKLTQPAKSESQEKQIFDSSLNELGLQDPFDETGGNSMKAKDLSKINEEDELSNSEPEQNLSTIPLKTI